jgi:hypothetical protein
MGGQKEKSRLSAGLSLLSFMGTELATALPLLAGVLTLTIRVLLLLAGLVAAALLLTGLLARVLVLLTRVLVLAGHRDLPCWTESDPTRAASTWFPWNPGFPQN